MKTIRSNPLTKLMRHLIAAAAGLAILSLAAPAPAWAGAEFKDKKLERLWKAKCSSCHGMDGKGETEQGKKSGANDMTKAEWQKALTDDQMKEAILNGFKREKNGKKQEMEGYKEEVKPGQVEALIAFIRGLAS
jgi:cytochrome c553